MKRISDMTQDEKLTNMAQDARKTRTNTGVIKVIIVIYFVFEILDALFYSGL